MKKLFLMTVAMLMAVCAMAQEEAAPSKWKKGVDLSL